MYTKKTQASQKKSVCSFLKWLFVKFLLYLKDFFENTTLHGFNHIVTPNRYWLEILFWALTVIGATACTVSLILSSWSRFQEDPTVVSLDKDYREWNTTFPGVTLCYDDKLDKKKAIQLIKEKWKVENGSSKFDYYMDFLNIVVSGGYDGLENFKKFVDDRELNNENLAAIMKQVNFVLKGYIINLFLDGVEHKFHETLTEMGICYSFNSLSTPYIKPGGEPIKKADKVTQVEDLLFNCSFLNSLCYGKIAQIKLPITYFVHAPFEVPDSTTKRYHVAIGYDSDTSFNFITISASSSLRSLSMNQRKCAFQDEPNTPESPFYSFNLCRMECRRKLCMELCQCVPHFYVKKKNQPFCNITGLICLSQHEDYIVQLRKEKKYPCSCYATCTMTEYFLDKRKMHIWKYADNNTVRFRWAVDLYTKTKLRRDIMYGFDDLLVSFGGTAGLFLGCSILSGVELVYYFTLRMIRYFCKLRHEEDELPTSAEWNPDETKGKKNRNRNFNITSGASRLKSFNPIVMQPKDSEQLFIL